MNILEARRRTLGADVYKKTVQGNPLIVRSLARMRPGLNVYGKSHQNTVAGNQLIPMTVGEEIVSKNGFVSAICTEDGINVEANVGIDITSDSNIYFLGTGGTASDYEEYPDFEAGKTYIARCDSINYSLYVSAFRNGSMTTLCFSDGAVGNATFIPEEGDTFRVFLRPRTVYTEPKNEVVHVMISSNMDAPIWEPYTGGKPSPSPDYPQEIVSVGDDGSIQVDVTGANICPETQRVNINIEETGNMSHYGYSGLIPVVPGEKYSINTSMIVKYFDESKEVVRSKRESIITPKENNKYIKIRTVLGVASLGDDFKIMINAGESLFPYEPYKQPQSLTVQTPNGLPGIPVSSGGNYTDENGQQWICDEIDFKRGKYVQRVELLRITDFSKTSKPSHTDLGNTECSIRIFGHYPDVQNMSHLNRSMCDSFIYSVIGDFVRFAIGSDTELRVYFTLNGVLNREEYIAKMEEISPTILFPIAAPIETDLTEEQMAAYANLHTNRPTTVVSATDGAGLRLIYKTKKSLEVTD